MKKAATRHWLIISIVLFWTGIFFAARFPPSEAELLLRYAAWSRFSGIALPANFAAELPFPLPVAVLSLITGHIAVNIFRFRIINLGLIFVWLFLARKLTWKYTGDWFLALAGTSLWLIWTFMSSVPALLALILITGLFLSENISGPKKDITRGFLSFWLAQTSFAGWIFVVIYLIYTLKSRFNRKVLVAGILITGYGFFTYHGVVPLFIKRLVYNKPFFAYRETAAKIVAQFSPERLAFPGQADATVARSLWGSKGLGWLAWWLLPLAMYGIFIRNKIDNNFKVIAGLAGIWGILGLVLGNTNDFLENGIGIAIGALLIASWLVKHARPQIKAVIGTVIVISLIPSLYHFLAHEEIWRDNRPAVQLVMARMGTLYHARQISTILGRSFLYFAWINLIPPGEFWGGVEAGMKLNGVKFDHFSPESRPAGGGNFVGLPGEFLGSRAKDNKNDFSPAELPKNFVLLDAYHTHDTVSFGNGDYIWTIQIN
jgi:hypothetical protein